MATSFLFPLFERRYERPTGEVVHLWWDGGRELCMSVDGDEKDPRLMYSKTHAEAKALADAIQMRDCQ